MTATHLDILYAIAIIGFVGMLVAPRETWRSFQRERHHERHQGQRERVRRLRRAR